MRVWSVWVRGRRRRRGACLEVWKDSLEEEEDDAEFDASRLQISLLLLFRFFLGLFENIALCCCSCCAFSVVYWFRVLRKISLLCILLLLTF